LVHFLLEFASELASRDSLSSGESERALPLEYQSDSSRVRRPMKKELAMPD
jgi:hypothetical protein